MPRSEASPQPRPLLAAIQGKLDTLPPAEARLAESLLADPDGFAARNINEAAQLAATSTTTVVRFYRRLGYQGYRELLRDLTQEMLREKLLTRELSAEASDVARDDTIEQLVAKVARDETRSISDTAEALDTQALERAVAAVAAARRVDIFGVGASSIVSIDLQRKLSRIGLTAIHWPDTHTAWTAAAILGEGNVALAISHSGRTKDTIEFLRLARAAGAATIAMTNVCASPLTEEADIVLYTAARETSFRSGALGSRIAQLMLVDCLFIGVAQADYDASVAAIRTTYDAVQPRSTPGS